MAYLEDLDTIASLYPTHSLVTSPSYATTDISFSLGLAWQCTRHLKALSKTFVYRFSELIILFSRWFWSNFPSQLCIPVRVESRWRWNDSCVDPRSGALHRLSSVVVRLWCMNILSGGVVGSIGVSMVSSIVGMGGCHSGGVCVHGIF